MQHDRLEADRSERVAAAQQAAVDPGIALADEGQREVCERGEITAGAHRASARHHREHATVQALDEQLDQLDART